MMWCGIDAYNQKGFIKILEFFFPGIVPDTIVSEIQAKI